MNLKKVKIDEHIKSVKQANSDPVKRKRGRPRKNPLPPQSSIGNSETMGSENDGSESFNSTQSGENYSNQASAPQIEPIYDTTPEAKGLLCTPFAALALLFQNQKLTLDESEIESLMPTFKPVYDNRIKPRMGENADLISFGAAFTVVLVRKVQVIGEMKKERARLERAKKEFEQAQQNLNPAPSINSEVVT
jgi:hypothetical protein